MSKNAKKSPKKQHDEELEAGEYDNNEHPREEREVEERDTGHVKSLKNFNKS